MPEFLRNNLVFEKIIILCMGRDVGGGKFHKRVPPFFDISGFSEPLWGYTHTSFQQGRTGSRHGRGW
jgi:hypothetical protein|tara:strand:+ start:493 stop:693 length:201 start_codon:yes stop_codon:yes gene_type:complete